MDSPETNKSFAQTLGLDYPLLSDPSKKVATAYGVVDEDQAFAARWTFYIGVDGRIIYIDKQVSPAAHGKEIAARLAELGIPKRRTSELFNHMPTMSLARNRMNLMNSLNLMNHRE